MDKDNLINMLVDLLKDRSLDDQKSIMNNMLKDLNIFRDYSIKYLKSLGKRHSKLADAYVNYMKITAGEAKVDHIIKNSDSLEQEFISMLLFLDKKYRNLIQHSAINKEYQICLMFIFDGWMIHRSAIDPETANYWSLIDEPKRDNIHHE